MTKTSNTNKNSNQRQNKKTKQHTHDNVDDNGGDDRATVGVTVASASASVIKSNDDDRFLAPSSSAPAAVSSRKTSNDDEKSSSDNVGAVWVCSACTFHNSLRKRRCEICGSRKTVLVDASAPPTTQQQQLEQQQVDDRSTKRRRPQQQQFQKQKLLHHPDQQPIEQQQEADHNLPHEQKQDDDQHQSLTDNNANDMDSHTGIAAAAVYDGDGDGGGVGVGSSTTQHEASPCTTTAITTTKTNVDTLTASSSSRSKKRKRTTRTPFKKRILLKKAEEDDEGEANSADAAGYTVMIDARSSEQACLPTCPEKSTSSLSSSSPPRRPPLPSSAAVTEASGNKQREQATKHHHQQQHHHHQDGDYSSSSSPNSAHTSIRSTTTSTTPQESKAKPYLVDNIMKAGTDDNVLPAAYSWNDVVSAGISDNDATINERNDGSDRLYTQVEKFDAEEDTMDPDDEDVAGSRRKAEKDGTDDQHHTPSKFTAGNFSKAKSPSQVRTPFMSSLTPSQSHHDDDENSEYGRFNYGFNYTPPTLTQQSSQVSSHGEEETSVSQSDEQQQLQQQQQQHQQQQQAHDDEQQRSHHHHTNDPDSLRTDTEKHKSRCLTSEEAGKQSALSPQASDVTRKLLDDLVHSQRSSFADSEIYDCNFLKLQTDIHHRPRHHEQQLFDAAIRKIKDESSTIESQDENTEYLKHAHDKKPILSQVMSCSESNRNSPDVSDVFLASSRGLNAHINGAETDQSLNIAKDENFVSGPIAAIFQTAGSNRMIAVTEEGMKKANQLFRPTKVNDVPSSFHNKDINETSATATATASSILHRTGSNQISAITESGKNKVNDVLSEMKIAAPSTKKPTVSSTAVFQSAGFNKTISVVKKFESSFFQTAGSGKSIHVTKDQITKAESLLCKTPSHPDMAGGSRDPTSSRTTTKESSTALISSTWTNHAVNGTHSSSKTKIPLPVAFVVPGSSRKIPALEDSLRCATHFLEESPQNADKPTKNNDKLSESERSSSIATLDALNTACINQTLHVSEDEFRRNYHRLYGNHDDEKKTHKEAGQHRKTYTKDSIARNYGSMPNAAPDFHAPRHEKDSEAPPSLFSSFHTAGSSQPIVVSKESIAKACRLLESKNQKEEPTQKDSSEQDYSDANSYNDEQSSFPTVMFQTAGLKTTLNVSEESLDRAAKFLENDDCQVSCAAIVSTVNCVGKKNNTIGSPKLAGQSISRDIEFSGRNGLNTFQTLRSSPPLLLSKENFDRAEELLHGPEKAPNPSKVQHSNNQTDDFKGHRACVSKQDDHLAVRGFQTAGSGQQIFISDESINEATRLLEGNPSILPHIESSAGHSTTSGLSSDQDFPRTEGINAHDGANPDLCTHSTLDKSESFCITGSSKQRFAVDENLHQTSLLLVEEEDLAAKKKIDSKNSCRSYSSTSSNDNIIAELNRTPTDSIPGNKVSVAPDQTSVSSVSRTLVRFGCVRRATYCHSSSSITDDENCDFSLPGQPVPSMTESKKASVELFGTFTPIASGMTRRSAHITLSTGEANALRKRDDESNTTLKPVAINFNKPTVDCNLSDPLMGAKLRLQQSAEKNCLSLAGAIFRGEMTNCWEHSLEDGVIDVILSINSENATQIRFDKLSELPACLARKSDATTNLGELHDYRQALLKNDCDEKKLKDAWIRNHTRWIIWKLASYERKFSHYLARKSLTYRNVLHQLLHRYNREITEGLRSPIRKILNRDITATKMMILVVCRTLPRPTPSDTSPKHAQSTRTLEVSDGWHSVKANVDPVLSEYVENGLIKPGTKLLISNALLVGEPDGIDPLDVGDGSNCDACGASLQLAANSTRLAKWNAKLGFVTTTDRKHSQNGFLLVKRISDIKDRGGQVPAIRLFVKRVYPLMFWETTESCNTDSTNNERQSRTLLTEQEEDNRRMEFETRRSRMAEKHTERLRNEVEKEVDEGAPEAWSKVILSAVPDEMIESLSSDEQQDIESWKQQRTGLIRRRLQEEIESELETETSLMRKSTPFLRVLVQSIFPKVNKKEHALLTIWNPTEDQQTIIREGTAVQAFQLGVRGETYDGMLHLAANGRTTFASYPIDDPTFIEKMSFRPRRLLSIFEVHKLSRLMGIHCRPINTNSAESELFEVDVAGVEIYQQKRKDPHQSYTTYLTDESGLVLQIHVKKLLNSIMPEHTNPVEFPVYCFRDLRIRTFDVVQSCAVAEYGELSSTLSSHPRLEELNRWTSSTLSNTDTLLLRLSSHLKAMLPFYAQRGERKLIVGCIVDVISFSKKEDTSSVIVDCNGFESHVCEIPSRTLHKMIQILQNEDGHQATLCLSAEEIAASLGLIDSIFRCRGFLWRFLIHRTITGLANSKSKYVIEEVWKADKTAFGQAIDAWQRPCDMRP